MFSESGDTARPLQRPWYFGSAKGPRTCRGSLAVPKGHRPWYFGSAKGSLAVPKGHRPWYFGSAKGPRIHMPWFFGSAKGPQRPWYYGSTIGPRTCRGSLTVPKDHRDHCSLAVSKGYRDFHRILPKKLCFHYFLARNLLMMKYKILKHTTKTWRITERRRTHKMSLIRRPNNIAMKIK